MAGLVPVAEFQAAGDITSAALIQQPGSRTQNAVDGRIVPVAADIITNSPDVVQQAAAAAAEIALDDEGLARVTLGKNLFDPSKRIIGYTLGNSGQTLVLVGYSVTDYIPVVAGQPITLSAPRNVSLYDTSKVFVTGSSINNSTQAPVTVTPTVDGFVRASISDANVAMFQVEKGSAVTAWEAYQRLLDPTITIGGSQLAPLVTSLEGNTVGIQSAFGDRTLTLSMTLADPARNGVLNFNSMALPVGVFHGLSDSVAPIRTQQGTIGANHGFAFIGLWVTHDKTAADLGSVWTDGTREYVLLKVDSDGAWVGGSYVTAGDGSTSSANVDPAADLTHVSGATHTTAMPQGGFTLQQMYPAIARRVVSATLDAAPLASSRGNEVVFRETYDILDYASLYDLAKANVGVPYTQLPVAGAVRVESEWRVRAGMKMLGWVALTELSPTALGQTGFFQCEAMAIPAEQTRYLPGVKPIGARDYSNGVPHAALTVSEFVTDADLHNPAVPPTVLLDWREDYQVGFIMAYEPWTAAATSNQQRLTNTPSRLWDLRNTRKIYPNAIMTLAPGWGRVEAHGYRAYVTVAERDQILARKTDALAASSALRTIIG